MADPSNVLAVDDIAIMTGYEVRVAVAPPEDIADLISRLDRLEDVVAEQPTARSRTRSRRRRGRRPARDRRRRAGRQAGQPDRRAGRRAAAPPTSTSRPTDASCACASGSTACCTTSPPSRAGWPPGVVSRMKIMAELNIAEQRLPQDGRVGLDGRRPPRRPARRDAAERPRRGGRDAHPRQGRRS